MANKKEIIDDAKKAWRTENGLVGVKLEPNERAEMEAFVEKALAVALEPVVLNPKDEASPGVIAKAEKVLDDADATKADVAAKAKALEKAQAEMKAAQINQESCLKPSGRECTANLATLGTRTAPVLKDVEEPVMRDGQPMTSDNGRPIMRRRETMVNVTQVGGLLNLEEAMSLGDQLWTTFVDGKFSCSAGGRRFVVEAETFEAMCQA